MGKRELVFNTQKRRVLRKHISGREAAFGAFFIGLVVLMGLWFAAQKNRYNPAERDISFSMLEEQSVEDTLYRTPLVRWVEPGQELTASVAPSLTPFPAAVLDGGWTPASRLQQFDASNLYEKIDGAAEQYLQFGFQRLDYLALAGPGDAHELSIELYDMATFQNALGIFAAQRDADAAVEKRGPAFFHATDAGALGILDRYFFKLVGTDDSDVVRGKALDLVTVLADLPVEAGTVPRPFRVLAEDLGVDFGGIAYLRNDAFQYSFAENFWFGQPDPASDLRYFIHEDTGPEAADALYQRIVQEHQVDHTLVDQGAGFAVLQHNFLKTYAALTSENGLVYGVEGAPDADVARQALTRLQEVL